MTSTIFSRTQVARRIATACGVGVLLVGASACGSDPAPASQGTTTNEGGGTGTGPSTSQQGQRPGANGKIAAVADSTAQVQSVDSGQVAVTWNASTTFTKQVSAKLSDISVGDCVMVTSADTGTASGDSTQPPTQPTAVTATSVRISEPVDGSCTPTGAAGPGGGGPQFQGSPPQGDNAEGGQPPAGGQGGTPPNGARFRGLGGAVGEVTSVSKTGFVVASTRFAAPQDGSSTPTQESVDVTVTVTGSTTFSTTAKGAASDVKVGQCLQATGEADDTGTIAATRIAVTAPVDGECGAGPGGASFRRSTGTGPGAATQAS